MTRPCPPATPWRPGSASKLHRLTEEDRYQERALGILQALQTQARENPWGFAHLLTVQALYLTPPVDLTLVGDPGDPRTQALLQAVYRYFLPERRLLLKNPAAAAALEDPGARPAAYSSRTAPRWPTSATISPACRASGPRELANELSRPGGKQG